MPVVPFTSAPTTRTSGADSAPLPQPDPTFTMMAAAQMHEQGRLIQPTSNLEPFDEAQSQRNVNKKPPDYQLPKDSEYNGYTLREDMEEPEQGKNFETLYNQLSKHKDLKEDDYLILHTKKGNQFWYRRDDNYEPGFRLVPRPEGQS